MTNNPTQSSVTAGLYDLDGVLIGHCVVPTSGAEILQTDRSHIYKRETTWIYREVRVQRGSLIPNIQT